MEKPTRVRSPARGKYSRRPRSARPSRARISAEEKPIRAPTSPPWEQGGLWTPRCGPHRQPPRGPASRAPPPPSVPPPASSGSPRSAGCGRGAQRRGAGARSRPPAGVPWPLRSLPPGRSNPSSSTPRAPEPGPTRGSARAQCSRPGCAQASALGPAHAPVVARLLPAPLSPSTGRRSAAAAPAVSTLTGVWRAFPGVLGLLHSRGDLSSAAESGSKETLTDLGGDLGLPQASPPLENF